MTQATGLKAVIKRGVLLTAANWPLVLVQFAAESTFKLLLAVPVVGGAFLVALVLGAEADEFLSGDVRAAVAAVAGALAEHPAALVAFLASFAVVLVGGAAFTFLVKGGTVAVMTEADRAAGPIERAPLRLQALQRAAQYDSERFVNGSTRLFRRYLWLGLGLLAVYGLTAAAYLGIVFGGYGLAGNAGFLLGWSLLALTASSALIVWITIVNLFYLLVQIVIAADDRGVTSAIGQVARFARAHLRDIAAVFGLILLLVVAATIVSILAAGGLGLIAFVPFVGLAVFPLQIAAWLLRGVIFQFLGLTALGAYLSEYRRFVQDAPSASPWIRSA
jgi:hypothetical protein